VIPVVVAVAVLAMMTGCPSNGAGNGGGGSDPETYSVGDTGPAGGIVFYDKGSYSDGWRYLEAAPSDQSAGIQWGGTSVGGTGTAIGTGAANTQAIVAALEEGDYAAKLCDDLEYGGYSDWFLPSRYELNAMYTQSGAIGGFASAYFWSSSEVTASDASFQHFGNGGRYDNNKNYELRVRAARAF